MKFLTAALAMIGLAAVAACSGGEDSASTEVAAPIPPDLEALLTAAITGEHRSEEERLRDQQRHPKETLLFFEIEPDMNVVEIWPGGGWYTKVIAPYLASGGGVYFAANFDPENANERVRAAYEAYKENYVKNPEIYGTVVLTVLGEEHDVAPAGSADTVLTFRNVHNWMARGVAQDYFVKFYDALKPGGVLGVVEHRADPGKEQDPKAATGYVREDAVIAMAEKAGFKLEAKSEINANPKDTKDHPFGVWTLPPVRRSAAMRGTEDPNFDRAKYEAIGESDRMTLKFRKPLAADGALLE